MAHKTLINATEHEITGGVTLVNGTSYKVNNGKVLIGGAEYDISFLLPPAALDLWSDSGNNTITCITYANGYYVVCGQFAAATTGSNMAARIAYATSLDGTWTIKDLWTGNDSVANCITYGNGYWVVGGHEGSGNYYGTIAFSTNLSGNWTVKRLWGTSYGDNAINCITFANGYWVAGGIYRSGSTRRAYISYTTIASPNSTWTNATLWSNSAVNEINGISYANKNWVAVGVYNNLTARLAYAISPDQIGWTTVDLWSNSGGIGDVKLSCVTYTNGYWVVGGSFTNSGAYYGRIAYTTSLGAANVWTIKNVFEGFYSRAGVNDITYDKGHWVVAGYKRNADSNEGAYIAYATSLDGPWTEQELWLTNNNTYPIEANCVAYINGYWVVGGKRYDGSVGSGLRYAHLEYSPTLNGFSKI